MPRELVAIAPRTPVIREYAESPLKPNQVLIKSEFSSPKHGTELGLYRDTSPFSIRHFFQPKDNHRIRETAFELLRTGRLQTDGLIDPIVPFEKCAEAYRRIDEHPEESIKLGGKKVFLQAPNWA